MQACGWRGHRTAFARVHGLVSIPVGGVVWAVDIRWQGYVPQLLDQAKEIGYRSKSYAAFTEASPCHYLSLQLMVIAKKETLTHTNLSSGSNQTLPLVRIDRNLPREQDHNPAP